MTRLIAYKGRNMDYTLTIKDQDAVPVPLGGATVKFMVKEKLTDTDANAKITKSSATPTQITIDSPTSGIVTVFLVPADTQSLTVRDYYWDIYVVTSTLKEYSSEPDEFGVKGVVRTD